MRGSSRSKTIAVFREGPIPLPLQNLHHRLLDQSIQHRRDTQLAHPAVRLSTYVMESCAFLARNFSRCASRSIFMGLWRHFARGSNFWNLALFGSGYAGLGDRKMIESGDLVREVGTNQ